MFDRMTVRSENDNRRERLTRSKPVKRPRSLRRTRTRSPFVAGSGQLDGRAR